MVVLLEAVSCRECSKWDRRWRYGSSEHSQAVLPLKRRVHSYALVHDCVACCAQGKRFEQVTSKDPDAYTCLTPIHTRTI